MRKNLVCLLVLTILFSLTACRINYMDSDEIHAFFFDLADDLRRSQISEDDKLIGTRETDDAYTGAYQAECNGNTGRDVIFGGGAVKERSLYISGDVKTESGSATVRIRLNDEVIELTPDENGYFETKLSLEYGGNYIMVQYEDFTGTVELRSAYDTIDSYKI